MAKSTLKISTHFDGNRDMQDILVELITEKIQRNNKIDVENPSERDYNHGVSCYGDPPRLAG